MKKLIVILPLLIGKVFLGALVFMNLYNWFATKALGSENIGYWLSFGIMLIISFINAKTMKFETNEDEDDEENKFYMSIAENITKIFIYLIIWGFAALVQLGV